MKETHFILSLKVFILLCSTNVLIDNEQPLLCLAQASEPGTFESFGHVFKTTAFDKDTYKNSPSLSEAMIILDNIRMAIQNRDIELYKKYASTNVINVS